MKVYLITHKDYKISPTNTVAWADIDKVGKNGIYVRSVKAFFKKKEAKKYIERFSVGNLQITTFENKP